MFPKDVWVETEDPEMAVSPLSLYQWSDGSWHTVKRLEALFHTTERLPGISMADPDEIVRWPQAYVGILTSLVFSLFSCLGVCGRKLLPW
jgi:hypothetical protein